MEKRLYALTRRFSDSYLVLDFCCRKGTRKRGIADHPIKIIIGVLRSSASLVEKSSACSALSRVEPLALAAFISLHEAAKNHGQPSTEGIASGCDKRL
jgi:hypothetical protein